MGFVSRHARAGGEEKKGGAGRSFDRSDCTHSLTYHMHSRKIEEHKTSVCHRAVCCYTTNYYLLKPSPPELREPIAKLPIPSQQTLTRAIST